MVAHFKVIHITCLFSLYRCPFLFILFIILVKLPKVLEKKKDRNRVEVIDLKVGVAIGEICMKLASNSFELCTLGVSGGLAKVILKKSYTDIMAKLRGIYLHDLHKYTLYKQVGTLFLFSPLVISLKSIDSIEFFTNMSIDY